MDLSIARRGETEHWVEIKSLQWEACEPALCLTPYSHSCRSVGSCVGGTHCSAQEQSSALTHTYRKLTAPLEAQQGPYLSFRNSWRELLRVIQSTAELQGSCGNTQHTAQSGATLRWKQRPRKQHSQAQVLGWATHQCGCTASSPGILLGLFSIVSQGEIYPETW